MSKNYSSEIQGANELLASQKLWFRKFESYLRNLNENLFEGVEFLFVGEIQRGTAVSAETIVITAKTQKSYELLFPKMRQAILDLTRKYQSQGKETYVVELRDPETPIYVIAAGLNSLFKKPR